MLESIAHSALFAHQLQFRQRRAIPRQDHDSLHPSPRLQVKAESGEWIDVHPIPNTFVVNLGDCLEHATGGLLKATAHRVKQRRGATTGRYSFPFFFDPSFDAQVKMNADCSLNVCVCEC